MRRSSEGPDRRLGVAMAHFRGNVVGCLVTHHGRASSNRLMQVHHHRQFLVVDQHRFCRVARLLQRAGQHHRHRLAHVAHPLKSQGPAQGRHARRSSRALESGRAGNRFDASGDQVSAVEDGDHARHGQGRRFVNAQDAGVRVDRAYKHQAQMLTVPRVIGQVIGESALPFKQLVVFDAEHRLATAKTGITVVHVTIPRLIGVCASRPSGSF